MLLVYLEQVNTEKDTLVSLKTIKEDMGITYTTLKNKIDNLEPLGLIFTTKRDREKVVVITEKGKQALREWEQTAEGKKIIEELKTKLLERKQFHNV